jgi:hypothetical protein
MTQPMVSGKIIGFCNARLEDLKKNIRVIPKLYILWDKRRTKGNWPADLTNGGWSEPEV